MVEFALVLPFLVLILFGIIEFGYLFAQHLDVRHGAREGARLMSVNYASEIGGTGPTEANNQINAMVVATCDRMDFATGAQVTVNLVEPSTGTGTSENQAGDYIEVTVEADPEQITGLFSTVIDPITLRSTVSMRIERAFGPLLAMSKNSDGQFEVTRTCP